MPDEFSFRCLGHRFPFWEEFNVFGTVCFLRVNDSVKSGLLARDLDVIGEVRRSLIESLKSEGIPIAPVVTVVDASSVGIMTLNFDSDFDREDL